MNCLYCVSSHSITRNSILCDVLWDFIAFCCSQNSKVRIKLEKLELFLNIIQSLCPQGEETLCGEAKQVISWTGLTARF